MTESTVLSDAELGKLMREKARTETLLREQKNIANEMSLGLRVLAECFDAHKREVQIVAVDEEKDEFLYINSREDLGIPKRPGNTNYAIAFPHHAVEVAKKLFELEEKVIDLETRLARASE